MVSTDRLLAFAVMSMLLIVIPGPSVLFVIGRALAEGFAVGVTNPKTIVFFAAVLPQFVDRGHGHVTVQMLLLGLVFNIIAVASDSVWGLVASTARSWFARSPRRLAMIGGIGGLTMISLGITVAATGSKD